MRAAPKPAPQPRYESIPVERFEGLYTHGYHSRLRPGQFWGLENWDIYEWGLKTRRGSTHLNDINDAFPDLEILSHCVWDSGEAEYLIVQHLDAAGTGSEFWACELAPTPDQPAAIYRKDGTTPLTRTGTLGAVQCAFNVQGDRVLAFHPEGNLVIELVSGLLRGRPMGLPKPLLDAVDIVAAGSGNLTGRFTVGLELLYRDAQGVERLASSPNRQLTADLSVNEVTVDTSNIRITGNNAILAGNDVWTHARIWISENQNLDLTDPAQPIDAGGTADVLYEVAVVTRAALQVSPGVWQYTITTPPAELSAEGLVVDIDRIELEPLPAAYTGCSHQGRCWVSRAQGVGDLTQANIFFANHAGTRYGEQCDLTQFIPVEAGGQQMIRLMSFGRHLIGILEGRTGRILNGEPENGFEIVDYSIGIDTPRKASVVPVPGMGLGLFALTNDGDLQVMGPDFRWSKSLDGRRIAQAIRNQTAAAVGEDVSFLYINGKLGISLGDGAIYWLHLVENAGWSKASYATYVWDSLGIEEAFIFSGGTRAGILVRNRYVVEIERNDLDTDLDTRAHTVVDVTGSLITHRWMDAGGRSLLELDYLSLMANISNPLYVQAYIGGLPWPDGLVAVSTQAVPYLADQYEVQQEREYQAYIQPGTLTDGNKKAIGSQQHFVVSTVAPAAIFDLTWNGHIEAGTSTPAYDPFNILGFTPNVPPWAAPDQIVFDAGDESEDRSAFLVLDAGDDEREPIAIIYERGVS